MVGLEPTLRGFPGRHSPPELQFHVAWMGRFELPTPCFVGSYSTFTQDPIFSINEVESV